VYALVPANVAVDVTVIVIVPAGSTICGNGTATVEAGSSISPASIATEATLGALAQPVLLSSNCIQLDPVW
jgi:hypothetical protein